uniref:ARAD1B10230p n=1 Tax=Blastobotrys adeninivorans TaxID=409370 RepID=A0A060T5D7_BLAAD
MATKNTATATLNNGVKIPYVGLGTSKALNDEGYKAVLAALKSGYRHIDTAYLYMNEEQVGRAVKDSGIPRNEIFVTSKLNEAFHKNPEQGIDISLKDLGMDYVDLYLIHWPVCVDKKEDGTTVTDHSWDQAKTWEGMQRILASGKAKAIGVSNFSSQDIEGLLKAPTTTVVPAVNQVELHPYLPQKKLVSYCQSKGIVVTAYSPLGASKNDLLNNPVIKDIAERNKVEPAQVIISWAVWRGIVTVPKSVTPKRIETNLYTFAISDDDGQKINDISNTKVERTCFARPEWGVTIFHDGDN